MRIGLADANVPVSDACVTMAHNLYILYCEVRIVHLCVDERCGNYSQSQKKRRMNSHGDSDLLFIMLGASFLSTANWAASIPNLIFEIAVDHVQRNALTQEALNAVVLASHRTTLYLRVSAYQNAMMMHSETDPLADGVSIWYLCPPPFHSAVL